MKVLFHIADRVSRFMHYISGFLLIVMMVTVLADVITRTLFGWTEGGLDWTFLGAVEIVSYALLFTIMFALPWSVQRGQVIVDLFTEKMSETAKHYLAAFYTAGFGLMGIGMAFRLFEAVGRLQASGETTQDLLLPMYWIYLVAACASVLLGLRGFLVCIEELFYNRSHVK